MGAYIDALILHAARELGSQDPAERREIRDRILDRLHRLLEGYLRLTPSS